MRNKAEHNVDRLVDPIADKILLILSVAFLLTIVPLSIAIVLAIAGISQAAYIALIVSATPAVILFIGLLIVFFASAVIFAMTIIIEEIKSRKKNYI
jgi:hypothetical protein